MAVKGLINKKVATKLPTGTGYFFFPATEVLIFFRIVSMEPAHCEDSDFLLLHDGLF